MRRIKFLSVFAAVALVISAWPGTAMAQGDAPPSIPGLGSSPDELTNADLARFVDLAFKEQITAPQAQAFYEQLTERQRQIISDLVGIKAGIPLIEWRRSIESYRHKTALLSSSTTSSKIAPQYAGEVWRQPIENAWTWGYPAGSTWASSYYSSPLCDDDSSDDDWTFYFPINSSNPDGLRWTSDSAQVYLAFMAAYGGNLNGYAFSWYEARLCIGTGGVTAAGGPGNVQANVFLHY